jgi:uncharacterized protein
MIIAPITAAIITQIIKIIIDASKNQFSWKDFNSYGGMPSSHTALVCSLSAIIGYLEGLNSAVFAIATIVALLIIRDAAGIRIQLGLHAKIINKRMSQIPAEESFQFPYLKERMGHSWLEIITGASLGLTITALYIIFFI